jgi:hypothetical protein
VDPTFDNGTAHHPVVGAWEVVNRGQTKHDAQLVPELHRLGSHTTAASALAHLLAKARGFNDAESGWRGRWVIQGRERVESRGGSMAPPHGIEPCRHRICGSDMLRRRDNDNTDGGSADQAWGQMISQLSASDEQGETHQLQR